MIFVDDLQWIDSASLKLIQLLMSETDNHYLLLIGAYRDNEVNAAHRLILILEEIQKPQASGTGNKPMEQLVSTLMEVLVENAGAEKGTFILHREVQLFIEAQYGKSGGAFQ